MIDTFPGEWLDSTVDDEIDSFSYSMFQLECNLAYFEQANVFLPVQVHQKVDITVRPLFHPRVGTEQPSLGHGCGRQDILDLVYDLHAVCVKL